MAHTEQIKVITAQPQGQMISNPFSDYNQEWSAGLFDCCNDFGQCIYANFCWICFLGSLATSISEPSASWLFCNPLAAYRMKVRATFKIRGDTYNDACAICCCPLCVGLQMRNELTNRGFS